MLRSASVPLPNEVFWRPPPPNFDRHILSSLSPENRASVTTTESHISGLNQLYHHLLYTINESYKEWIETRAQLRLLAEGVATAPDLTAAITFTSKVLGEYHHIPVPPVPESTADGGFEPAQWAATFNRLRDIVAPNNPITAPVSEGPQSLRSSRLIAAELAGARISLYHTAKAKIIPGSARSTTVGGGQTKTESWVPQGVGTRFTNIAADDWRDAKVALDRAKTERTVLQSVHTKEKSPRKDTRKRNPNGKGRGRRGTKRKRSPSRQEPRRSHSPQLDDPPSAANDHHGTSELGRSPKKKYQTRSTQKKK